MYKRQSLISVGLVFGVVVVDGVLEVDGAVDAVCEDVEGGVVWDGAGVVSAEAADDVGLDGGVTVWVASLSLERIEPLCASISYSYFPEEV